MVDFQPIQRSEKVSEYKPDLHQSGANKEQGPSGDPKEFALKQQETQTKEEQMRQKIIELMMQVTLQQMQHVIKRNLQQQKENSRQNR